MRKEEYFYQKGFRVRKDGTVISNTGNVVNGYTNPDGYISLSTRREGKNIKCAVHRLQAYQKFGNKMFKDGILCRHLNDNPADNSEENIVIGTNSDNMMDKSPECRLRSAMIATSFVRKYNRDDVKSFYVNNGKSYKKTMNNFNISSKGTLHFILNGRINGSHVDK